eukprot:SAG31_NODE_860_length_11431_cov_8.068920_7_plen_127_part_00
MCEVDNLMYAIGLQERVRARVEKEGRIYLEDVDTVAINRMKFCYGAVVLAAVFGGIIYGAFLKEGMQVGEDKTFLSSFTCFFVGNIAEAAIEPKATTKERLLGILVAVACWTAGFVVFRGMFAFTS